MALALLALLTCCTRAGEACEATPCDDDAVHAFGTSEGSISSNAILSANGSYGAGCALRAGQLWSVPFQEGAPLDHAALQVAKGDVACTLLLTSFRTGSGASALYTAANPISLRASFTSGVLFSSPTDALAADARLSSVDFAGTFALLLMVSESVNARDAGARTHYAYESLVLADAPLSYWRLDDMEPATLLADDFAGSAGGTLQSRAGAISWQKHAASGTDITVSLGNRVRLGVNQKAVYYAQNALGSADYAVSADVYVASLLSNDQAGVIARASPSTETYYFAGLVQLSLIGLPLTRRFELWRCVNGLSVLLASYDDAPVAGSTRRVSLEVVGNTLRASLDGTQRLVVTDNAISTGAPGILLGMTLGSLQSESAGLHLDGFHVRESARTRDLRGVNHGLYVQGVTRASAGALTVPNGSASFDGLDDYVEVPRQIANDFSIELWFKSTQGLGTAAITRWHQTAGLVDASAPLSNSDFGIGLRADGRVLAGTGKTCVLCGDEQQTLISGGTTAYNDGVWHHVVFTRSKALGAMTLYLDGAVSSTLASGGSTHTLDATTSLQVGRMQSGSHYFAGQIDELAVYPALLSAQAVRNHYQAGRF